MVDVAPWMMRYSPAPKVSKDFVAPEPDLTLDYEILTPNSKVDSRGSVRDHENLIYDFEIQDHRDRAVLDEDWVNAAKWTLRLIGPYKSLGGGDYGGKTNKIKAILVQEAAIYMQLAQMTK